jgi:hypothetical protein
MRRGRFAMAEFSPNHVPGLARWAVGVDVCDFFVENPLNRNAIGNRTEGFKSAPDGSLTIYVQKDAPVADKIANVCRCASTCRNLRYSKANGRRRL